MPFALVTGASGFIGGHVAEGLARRGWRVRCLVRDPARYTLAADAVELFTGDVGRPDSLAAAVAGADVVFHLAGLTCALHPGELLAVNCAGTAAVARACRELARPPVLVHVSSLAAAGPTERGSLRREHDEPAPVSNYGRSKRAGELEVEAAAADVPVTVVRPGIVFGERGREMLSMVRPIARFGVHAVPGFVTPPLSLIYVRDLVDLLVSAAEKGRRIAPGGQANREPGRGYYFAAVRQYPDYAELGRMIGTALGRGVRVLRVPRPFAWTLAGLSEAAARLRGKADIFNLDKIREAVAPSWACSPEAAENDLGFAPSEPLESRLRQTVEWYRREKWI
jgi:nucleoside-diphosphate-sugar epimerase